MPEPVNFSDHQQRRGRADDILDEAEETFRNFMLDDDYDAMACLKKIMARIAERRRGQ